MIHPDDKRLTHIPFEDILAAKGECFAWHDYCWCCHPERGLILFGPTRAPQANTARWLAEDLCERLYPWAFVRQFPLVLTKERGR